MPGNLHAIVSIHDVMPSTLDRVRGILERLPAPCRENLIMLVVPGLDWQAEQIDQLRAWQRQGIVLAGHGWTHEAAHIRGIYHRLHSLLISRRAAEHLSLSAGEIEALMKRNHAWFAEVGLDSPDLYVPPAWALGAIDDDGLRATPWAYLETTSGLTDCRQGRRRWLPLVGFEADTPLRQLLLSIINRANELVASRTRPLRISIHPFDEDYRLAAQMRKLLARVAQNVSVAQALDNR